VTNFDPASPGLLQSKQDVTFLLSSDLRFLECSPSWDSFARGNGGHGISSEEVRGKNILDFVPDVLRKLYEHKYQLVQYSGSSVEFDYHCSSPETIRLFRMFIRPLDGKILVVNRLTLQEECERRPALTLEQRREYVSTSGNFLTMCANCRKARRDKRRDAWDWIPEFLNDSGLQVSHGLCPRCLSLVYGDIETTQADNSS